MTSEKQKMLDGESYTCWDPELVSDRDNVKTLCRKLYSIPVENSEEKTKLCKEIFGSFGESCYVEPPFFCDYGYNIHLGKNCYFNFNCCVLDGMRVDIGDNFLAGPAVQIYTASHPLQSKGRQEGEFSKPVKIGRDVWIGGGAIILPGVTIGDRVVVGAGAVVTKDVPNDVLVAGNPARIIKTIDNDQNTAK